MGVADVVYKWVGAREPNGEPSEFFFDIPATDLTGADVAALDKSQIEKVESDTGKRLYKKVEAKADTKPAHADGKGGN